MPELPEVETISRDLHALLAGKRVARIDVRWARSVDARSLPLELLAGDVIERVGRIGKFVCFFLRSGRTLAVHLRMTGRLLVDPNGLDARHDRAILHFSDKTVLRFSDARKFGRLRLVEGDPAAALSIGPDPLDPKLDDAAFAAMLRRRKTPVKVLLLDQKRVSGIGNIYACEALYRARISPRRRAGRLNAAQRALLLRSLQRVLKRAIALRGSSVDDYVDAAGLQGAFQKLLNVYGRAGLPCRRCRTPIKRVELAQRGTFFCPACQR